MPPIISSLRAAVLASAWIAAGSAGEVTTGPASPVIWQRTYSVYRVGGSSRPAVLQRKPEGGFRVIGAAYLRDAQPHSGGSGKECWWIQDVDAAGQPGRFADFAVRANSNNVDDAIFRDDEVFLLGGLVGWLAKIDATGHLTRFPGPRTKGVDHSAYAMLPIGDRFLLAGETRTWTAGQSHADAWLGLVDNQGSIVWEKSFDRGEDETVRAISPTADGGCLLAINSGTYNKFGQGPSALWLVRCDAQGNRVADTVIPDGRINPSGRRYLARAAEGFVVSYTTSQLPPIDRVPLCRGPWFDARLACFDDRLQPRWEKQYTGTTSFGTSLVLATAEGSLLLVGAGTGLARITKIGPKGTPVSETTVPIDGIFNPVDAVLDRGSLAVLGGYLHMPSTTAPSSMPTSIPDRHTWILFSIKY